jgi:hypothetical protein
VLEPEDDVIPKRFEGCTIEWKDPSMDVTVEQVRGCREGASKVHLNFWKVL